jgi:tetratricopeptide (TPR) repeat protein
MSAPQDSDATDPTSARIHRADQECDRFEAAWKAGHRPNIEEQLAAVPAPERPALLRELILLEVDYRRLAGEDPRADEFLARFPDLDRAWIEDVLAAPAPVLPPLAAPPTLPGGETENALVGRRIGPYLIQQCVGSGGMGSVYRALRDDDYRQQVAVKVIRPGLDSDEILRRFRTERQVLAELQHAHIARLLDGGTTGDGRPYFVMEYIDGEPMDRYCDRHQLDTRERLRLLLTVCAAVQHAHQRGVLHRDLKPGNVLVTADGTPMVTDFGLAKRLEGQAGPSPAAEQTPSGAILGTPSYMAPEQAGGKAGPAADVYALGAILYELLTNQPPFQAATPVDTLLAVLSAEPVPPRRLQPKVARDLETICLKCLHKEPERRYASVAALADDLRRFLEGEAIQARPVGRIERLWRWCRRKPALAAAAACALLAVLIAGFFAYQAHRTEKELRASQRQHAEEKALLAAMKGDADEADKAIDEAESLGASAGQMQLLRGQVAFYRGDLEVARDYLEQAVKQMPQSVAAQAMLALVYHHGGQISHFLQAFVEIDQLTPHSAEDFLFKGQVESTTRPERALQTLDEAIGRRDSIIGRAVRLEARANYALVSDNLDVAAGALDDAQVAKSMLPGNPVVLARSVEAHLIAAGVFSVKGKHERSKAAVEQAGRDAQALAPFASMPQAADARFYYFDYVDDEDAALAASKQGTGVRHAVMLYRRGDSRKALQAADQIRAKGLGIMAQFERSMILAELYGRPRALADLQHTAAGGNSLGGRLGAPLILLFLGQTSEAVQAGLKSRPDELPPWERGWFEKYLKYLGGRLEASALLEAAGSCRPKQSAAHLAIGLRCLAEGDRAGARDHFQKCADARVFNSWEYPWVRAFLKRLEEDRTWPPWIPLKN